MTENDSSNSDPRYKTVFYSKLDEEVTITNGQDNTATIGPNTAQKQYTVDDAIEALGFGFLQIRLYIFSALVTMADAMEMMILAVLSPAVACQWLLSSQEEALITTVVFVGMLIGSLHWGIVSDRYGRKHTLWVCTFFISFFGILTAFVPFYAWLLIVRFIVGFFIAAIPTSFTYYSEFLPAKYRSICLILLEFAWAIGSCFEAILALVVMQGLSWRYLVGFSAIPILIVLVIFPFVPRSPRYLVSINKISEAEKVLQSCARQNCRRLPEGILVAEKKTIPFNGAELSESEISHDCNFSESEMNLDASTLIKKEEDKETHQQTNSPPCNIKKKKTKSGNFLDLFSKKYCLTTVYLLYIWFANGFVYYGTVLVTTLIFVNDHHCDASLNQNQTSNATCGLQTQDYLEFLITSSAEFPGIILTLVLSDVIGRKLTFFTEFTLSAVAYMLLFTCLGSSEFIAKTVILFIIRGSITGAFQAAYVYTPEAYPTHIRATALSLCSGFSRIGAIITPFIAQVLLKTNFIAAIMVYGGCAALAAVISLLLPVETKGKRLEDIEKEFESRASKKYSFAAMFVPSFDIFRLRNKTKSTS